MEAFLTIKTEQCTTEYTKEQFISLMHENGIRCDKCSSWTPPSAFRMEYGEKDGVCAAISAAGGAFHSAGTYEDDFCSYFTPKQTNG